MCDFFHIAHVQIKDMDLEQLTMVPIQQPE